MIVFASGQNPYEVNWQRKNQTGSYLDWTSFLTDMNQFNSTRCFLKKKSIPKHSTKIMKQKKRERKSECSLK